MPLSPRLRWKLQRFQNSVEEYKEKFRDLFKTALVKQKICPACRALVGANETKCPFCGEYITALDRIGVRRVTSSVMPDINSTMLLMGLNFLMFLVCLIASAKEGAQLAGMMGFDSLVLIRLGSNYGPAVVYGQYWRLLSGAFLHGGLIHLLFNMWVLKDVGQTVEEMYGSSRYIVLYTWTAIAGSVATIVLRHGAVNMVGASGAIFGLFGVLIAYGYRRRTGIAEQIRSMYIRWAIYGLVFGFIFGADNWAHLGGLAGGLIFGFLVSDMPPVTRESILFWRYLSYACWLAIGGCLLAIGFFYQASAQL